MRIQPEQASRRNTGNSKISTSLFIPDEPLASQEKSVDYLNGLLYFCQ